MSLVSFDFFPPNKGCECVPGVLARSGFDLQEKSSSYLIFTKRIQHFLFLLWHKSLFNLYLNPVLSLWSINTKKRSILEILYLMFRSDLDPTKFKNHIRIRPHCKDQIRILVKPSRIHNLTSNYLIIKWSGFYF